MKTRAETVFDGEKHVDLTKGGDYMVLDVSPIRSHVCDLAARMKQQCVPTQEMQTPCLTDKTKGRLESRIFPKYGIKIGDG